MGTNYYMIGKDESGNRTEYHLGKKSKGWNFMFRGRNGEVTDYATWERMVRTLDKAGWKFWNDNGCMLSVDNFLVMVRQKAEKAGTVVNMKDWLDADGNYFCSASFC